VARSVGVGGNLPTGEIDRLEPGADHLHRLIAGHGAEAGNIGLGAQQLPKAIGAAFGQGVPHRQRTAQTQHVLR